MNRIHSNMRKSVFEQYPSSRAKEDALSSQMVVSYDMLCGFQRRFVSLLRHCLIAASWWIFFGKLTGTVPCEPPTMGLDDDAMTSSSSIGADEDEVGMERGGDVQLA